MPIARTTVCASTEALDTLRAEAKLRGVPLNAVLAEAIDEKAFALRKRRRGELDYWCAARLDPGTWGVFMEDVLEGVYRIEEVTRADLKQALEVQHTHADMPIGLVDASVFAVGERLRETRLATLDRRRFSVIRPSHVAALELLPS